MQGPNRFKIGTNFDPMLVTEIEAMNAVAKTGFVNEVYGSIRQHAKWAARPEFRLPERSIDELVEHVKDWRRIGVDFNYTLNTISFGSKRQTLSAVDELRDLLYLLDSIGVARITVADMLLLDIIRNNIGWNGSIEISTIAHVDTVTQLKYLREEFGVDKVCNNLLKNRSVRFLTNAAAYCKSSGLILDLMVNEFCASATENHTTHCLFRDSCYRMHASNVTKQDALDFKNYPMGHCMGARGSKQDVWIKTMFVLPQDLQRYNSIGIDNWKITGRTGTTNYITRVVQYYLEGTYDDNLLALWKPLGSIYNERPGSEDKHATSLDSSKLDNFLDHWFDNPDFDCANYICGDDGPNGCNYCDKFLENMSAK